MVFASCVAHGKTYVAVGHTQVRAWCIRAQAGACWVTHLHGDTRGASELGRTELVDVFKNVGEPCWELLLASCSA